MITIGKSEQFTKSLILLNFFLIFFIYKPIKALEDGCFMSQMVAKPDARSARWASCPIQYEQLFALQPEKNPAPKSWASA